MDPKNEEVTTSILIFGLVSIKLRRLLRHSHDSVLKGTLDLRTVIEIPSADVAEEFPLGRKVVVS